MIPIRTTEQVFAGMHRAKKGSAYCTNFYPAQQKWEAWIARSELHVQHGRDATFFLRKDRDFWHLYFCASSLDALQRDLGDFKELETEPMVTDILGNDATMDALMPCMKSVGLRCYKKLVRMVRPAWEEAASPCDDVHFAHTPDAREVQEMLEGAFDRYAKQLPSFEEIETAAEASQILLLKRDAILAGLLFFETCGVTSTLRYWAVSEKFRGSYVGSSLMRHYLASQRGVCRFTLWVDADHHEVIGKYRHYHYATDGVVDYVLANDWIQDETD